MRSDARSLAGARSAASSAAAPEMAERQSVRSRRASAENPGEGDGSSTSRTKLPAAAAAAGLDEPGRAQHGERLAQRHRRDLQPRGELGLGRQLGTGLEDAGADRLADATHDLLDGALRAGRPERDLDRERRA